jgi:Putative peptidoglycan binding domain
VIVMQGTLADLDLASLAVVTSLGRTSLRLEVTDPSGELVGKLVLKAGRVVSATGGGVRGRNALQLIMGSAGNSHFRLVREPLDYELSSALASVDELAALGRPPRAHSSSERLEIADPPPVRASSDPSARVRMMEGRFDEFDLATVLHTIGMGRSCVELDVRDNARALIGAVRIKAGMVVSAQARNVEGIAAFSALMRAPDCYDFVAFRIDGDLANVAALGTVTQLVLGASDPGPSVPIEAVPILEGSLAEFDVPTLLQTVACGRQHCALEIYDDERVVGTIELKSNQVLSAVAGSLTARQAVHHLIGLGAPHRFRLIRRSGPIGDQAPVGSIHQLLLPPEPSPDALAARPAEAAAVVSAPAPVVVPPDGQDRAGRPIVPELMPVMEGRLEDFDFRTLLEALAVTRQYAQLQILGRDDAPLGDLQLKSGMIVSARAGIREGTEALAFLLGVASHCRFRMLAGAFEPSGPPLGSIRELLAVVAATAAQRRSMRASRLLRIAIPTSFLLGGAIVFVVVRAPRPATPSSTAHDPVVSMAVQPAKLGAPPSPPAPPPPAPPLPAPPLAAAPPEQAVVLVAPEDPVAPPTPVAAPRIEDAAAPPRPDPQKATIANAQAALKRLGYDPGPIDNVYGERTRRALRRFQRKFALRLTGVVDDETWSAIVGQLIGN